MKASEMTKEEKRQITNARQNAVRNAWKEEQARVENGQGTRNWSPVEQKELLETGHVTRYEGHHMKSVSLSPEQAGNPDNIQFLSESEHLDGAHRGSYHNTTNGYYDPQTGIMHEFSETGLEPAPVCALTEPYQPGQEGEISGEESEGGEDFDYTGGPSEEGPAQGASYMEGVEESGAEAGAGAGAEAGSSNSQGYE